MLWDITYSKYSLLWFEVTVSDVIKSEDKREKFMKSVVSEPDGRKKLDRWISDGGGSSVWFHQQKEAMHSFWGKF